MASKRSGQARARALQTLAIGVVTVAVVFAINARYPAMIEVAELTTSDFRMYTGRQQQPLGVVAIVAIDDKSIAELGRWQWPRVQLAKLVSALKDYKVATTGFDVVASETDATDTERESIAGRLKAEGLSAQRIADAVGPSNDEAFAQALRENGSVFMGFPFESHGSDAARMVRISGFVSDVVPPAPKSYTIVRRSPGPPPNLPTAPGYLPNLPIITKSASGSAYFDADADRDAVIRSELTVIEFKGKYYVPLFLALTAAYMKNAPLTLNLEPYGVAGVRVGTTEIPVDELGHMMVKFRGPERTFPHYSATDVINHRLPPSALEGKIVLVGVTARGLGDRVTVPFGGDYPGVEIHANAIDDVLQGDFVRRSRIDAGISRYAAIGLGLAVTLAAALLSATGTAVVTFAFATVYFGLVQYLLIADGLLLGILFPLSTIIATYTVLTSYRYFTEGREKRYLRLAFGHYLHPRIIESVVDRPGGLRLSGERRHLSILFSDIVGFTSRAERANAEELVALLNTYMTAMTDLILESGGVVDKLMGDGIMAFWGAPAEVPNPARSALDTALKMLDKLDELRKSDERFRDLNAGIGIATGEAIVGNFGGERRFDYSVIGDVVNLASRIEGLTRHFKVRVLVTAETWTQAATSNVVREIGLVKVKGKAKAVPLIEVVGASSLDGAGDDYYARFSRVVQSLSNGVSRVQAREQFEAFATERPADRVAQMYVELLNAQGDAASEIAFEFETK